MYKNSESLPLLKKSFTVFLDLLGFSEEIICKSNLGQGNEHLMNIYKAFSSASSILDGYSVWEKKIFSDNILLGCPITNSHIHSESLFGSLITGIMQFQLQLTLKNYFVRGGWSLGDLFVDDNTIYGEALIQAVNLEKQSYYPRIILSKEVENVCKLHLEYYNPKFDSPQNFHLLKDDEGNFFINYLYAIYPEDPDEDIDRSVSNLLIHKNNIISNLNIYDGNTKIYDKYIWAAQYHNYFCREFFNVNEKLIIEIPPKINFYRIVENDG